MLFHKKTFIFASENEMWKDLSSLQPQKKMLKHILFCGDASEHRNMHVYSPAFSHFHSLIIHSLI